jgi:hypothetical protein
MKPRGFGSVAIAVCGLAAALFVPAPVHADDLIGTGVVMAAVQIGAPQNIQVVSGDEQTGEWIANYFTGMISAGLYDGSADLLTADGRYDIGKSYPEVGNGNVYIGKIYAGDLAGAQVISELLGFVDELHPYAVIDVQWNGIEVQWEEVGTTISSYNPS